MGIKNRVLTSQCQGISKKTGPCRLPTMNGSDKWCNMHNPEYATQRIIRARKSGKAPRTIITKLEELRINDTLDMNVAVKKVIEDILRKGKLNTTGDVNVLNGLIKTAIVLEQNAEVPKKLREIESLLQSKEKQLATS